MPTYHPLNIPPEACLQVEDETDLIIAGDGVYSSVHCFGMSIPFPLVLCEIRGLLKLSNLLNDFMRNSSRSDIPSLPFAPSYHVLTRPGLPDLDTTRIYQYVIAHEGVFLLGSCPGLEVLMPISAPSMLPGLASASPYIKWKYPRISEEVLQDLFERARAARIGEQMLERLFYLTWEDDQWHIHEPEQIQSQTSVRVTSWAEADEMAIIEGHSHHDMGAYFSSIDNRDEIINGGFKVYFVLGRVNTQPQIRTRICVHGYSWEVPASHFFMLPAGIVDCVEQQQ
jgi:PRTRC genetic system protein A